jgi:hypothetical protein
MADKKPSIVGIVATIATSVITALIIRALTIPEPGGADVLIAAYDFHPSPTISAGEWISPLIDVHNRGAALAERCRLSVGVQTTTAGGAKPLSIAPPQSFSLAAGETRQFSFSVQVPEGAQGGATARAVLRCGDAPESEVRKLFEVQPGT